MVFILTPPNSQRSCQGDNFLELSIFSFGKLWKFWFSSTTKVPKESDINRIVTSPELVITFVALKIKLEIKIAKEIILT